MPDHVPPGLAAVKVIGFPVKQSVLTESIVASIRLTTTISIVAVSGHEPLV